MNKEDLLKELVLANIAEARAITELAKDYELTNSQLFLWWQDELNKISVE